MFHCVNESLYGDVAYSAASFASVRDLLDDHIRNFLKAVLPDTMRFARWSARQVAKAERESVVISSSHVASSLFMHPQMGVDIIGFASRDSAPRAPMFPLARDLLHVAGSRTEINPEAEAPVVAPEGTSSAEQPTMKLMPQSFVVDEINKYSLLCLSIHDQCWQRATPF